MATKLISQVFSTLFLACIFLKYFPGTTRADNECQYPCYPPPTGTGTSTTPAYTTPPPPPSQIVSYPPPAGYTPTPTGYYPYNPPPPYGTLLNSPPPPDPILPYFPFYYNKPLHQTDQSAATTLGRSTVMVVAVSNLLVFISMFCSAEMGSNGLEVREELVRRRMAEELEFFVLMLGLGFSSHSINY